MVWNIEFQRAAAVLASGILASIFLAGCVADTSRTHLDWGQNAVVQPRPTAPAYTPHREYTYHSPQAAALNCPTPRAKPAWYTARNIPAPSLAPAQTPIQPIVNYGAVPSFVWPVRGQVISNFGTNGNGERNDGINIAASLGTPIRASASGTISYAGNELRSYGNLVLIKHDEGYVTAYAHADRIIVNRGDWVAKGQIIAYAGNTGDVTVPQLHFEIRHGVQPLNPRALLTASNAS